MKKIVYLLMAFIFVSGSSFAQNKAGKAVKDPAAKSAPALKAEPKPKTEAKPKAEPKQEAKGATKLKKDGTPDMRYKENKEAGKKKPEGPMKKDGTPDMRHKANKEAAGKK